MIQVLTTKTIRFKNPNNFLVNPKSRLGESDQVKISSKYEDVYVTVLKDKVTAVPDWVKTDSIWDWCVKDGSLMEIAVSVSSPGADLQAKGQQQLAQADADAAKAAKEKAQAELLDKLQKMTKLELIQYAFDNHDVELSPAMTKGDILATIHEAMKQVEAA
jgi:hypothetical protein